MKEHIIGTLSTLVQNVLDGEEDAIRGYGVLKGLQEYIEHCQATIKSMVLAEVEKYPEKKFERSGYRVEFKSGRRTWDFKGCATWATIKSQLEEEEGKLKAAYGAYEKGISIATEDGEEVVLPSVKFSESSIIIKEK